MRAPARRQRAASTVGIQMLRGCRPDCSGPPGTIRICVKPRLAAAELRIRLGQFLADVGCDTPKRLACCTSAPSLAGIAPVCGLRRGRPVPRLPSASGCDRSGLPAPVWASARLVDRRASQAACDGGIDEFIRPVRSRAASRADPCWRSPPGPAGSGARPTITAHDASPFRSAPSYRRQAGNVTDLFCTCCLFRRRLCLRCEQHQPDRPGKDEDIRNVEDKRVVDPAAGHVQEIQHIAIKQPVNHIGQRTADQQARAKSAPAGPAWSRRTQISTASADRPAPTPIRHPAGSHPPSTNRPKVDAPVLAIAKIQEAAADTSIVAHARKLHHVDHHIFADLIDQKAANG